MMNIIRSQIYSMKRDFYTYICLTATILSFIIMYLSVLELSGDDAFTGSFIFTNGGELFSASILLSIVLFATRLCGWDFNDKTINYEVLYGHDRSRIFWARTVVSIGVSAMIALLFIAVPTAVGSAVNGWGTLVPVREAVLRTALLIPSFMRLAAIFILITIIFRSSWTAMILGFTFSFLEVMAVNISNKLDNLLSISGILNILEFSNITVDIVDGAEVEYFSDKLSASFITHSLAANVIVIAVSLLIAHALFRKRDMS